MLSVDREPLPYSTTSGAQSNSRIPFQKQQRESGSGFPGGPPPSYPFVEGYGVDPDVDMPMRTQEEEDKRKWVVSL